MNALGWQLITSLGLIMARSMSGPPLHAASFQLSIGCSIRVLNASFMASKLNRCLVRDMSAAHDAKLCGCSYIRSSKHHRGRGASRSESVLGGERTSQMVRKAFLTFLQRENSDVISCFRRSAERSGVWSDSRVPARTVSRI